MLRKLDTQKDAIKSDKNFWDNGGPWNSEYSDTSANEDNSFRNHIR